MATKIGTLQNPDKTEALLPRTCLKAVADKNGDYIDEDVLASDINALKNGAITSLNTALTPTSQTVDYTSRLSTIYRSSCYLVGNMLNVNFNAMTSSGTDPKIATLPFSLPNIIDFVIERADGSVSPAYAVGNEMFFNAPQPTSVGVLCNVWFPVIVPQT